MTDLENAFEKLKCAKEIVDDVSKDYMGFLVSQRLQCACGYIGDAIRALKEQETYASNNQQTYSDVDEADIADVMSRIDDVLEETSYQTLGYDNISTPFFQVLIGRK